MALIGRPFGWTFKLVMVVAMVACVLMLVSQVQGQTNSTPGGGTCNTAIDTPTCLNNTASPNPVTVGQPLTFTITISSPPSGNCAQTNSCGGFETLTDALPAGLTFVSASDTNCSGCVPAAPSCFNSGNTVTCPAVLYATNNPATATIVATPTQCGNFINTATTSPGGGTASAPFSVTGC